MIPATLSEEEAARKIGCSVKTLRRRNIPVIKHGRKRLYREEVIGEFLRQCEDARQQVAQPLRQSSEPKTARPIGSRAGASRYADLMGRLPQDELSEALALICELKAKGKRNARNGTGNLKRGSATRG